MAVADGVAYALPEMGHFQKENAIVLPTPDATKTYLLIPEDRGTLDSQLYLYAGTKVPDDPNPIVRNGLVNGDLYVFRADDPRVHGEAEFGMGDGTLQGQWVKIPKDIALGDQAALETFVQSVNAFDFVRVEDGATSKTESGVFYFTATGNGKPDGIDPSPNPWGRVYQMRFDNPVDPLAGAGLTTLIQAQNQYEPVINPDNLDIDVQGRLTIQENVNREWRGQGVFTTGEGRIWQYDTTTGALTELAELSQLPAQPVWGTPDNPAEGGTWESSGVVDVSQFFGAGSWLFDVQANTLDNNDVYKLITGTDGPPPGSSFEVFDGGQLILLRTANTLDGGDGGNGGNGGNGSWIFGSGGDGGNGGKRRRCRSRRKGRDRRNRWGGRHRTFAGHLPAAGHTRHPRHRRRRRRLRRFVPHFEGVRSLYRHGVLGAAGQHLVHERQHRSLQARRSQPAGHHRQDRHRGRNAGVRQPAGHRRPPGLGQCDTGGGGEQHRAGLRAGKADRARDRDRYRRSGIRGDRLVRRDCSLQQRGRDRSGQRQGSTVHK